MKQEELGVRIGELCSALLKLETVEECKNFLDDLCTYKEVEQMALRLYSAKLFLEGKTYSEIIAATGLSSATVSRVSRCVNHGNGGYKSVLGDDGE